MANGIRLKKLRRSVEKSQKQCDGQTVLDAWYGSEAKLLEPWRLDTTYIALPKDVWDDVLQHLGIGDYTYESERRDCDDFAFAMRGRIPLELRVNGVATVLDWSGRHAYNALLYTDGPDFRIGFIEPQGDGPEQWWVSKPGGEGLYDMDRGIAIF